MLKMHQLAGAFALFLFLSFVNFCNGDTEGETIVVFKGATTEVVDQGNDNTVTKRTPFAFRVPAFVGGVLNNKTFFAVLCDAHYDQSLDSNFIEPAVKTSFGDYKQWSDANSIAHNLEINGKGKVISNATAVMKGNKIYVLATSLETSSTVKTAQDSNTEWDSLMFVGTVKISTESDGNDVTIVWEKKQSLKGLLKTTNNKLPKIYFTGGVGNGVIMKNGTIVLPIQITHKNKDNDNNGIAASIIYSDDDGETWHMGEMTYSGTTEGSIVEFGEGKLLLSVHFLGGFREVYESDNMGNTWKESQVLTEVWGNDETRQYEGSQGSVISAPVDGKDVLLFSHPLNTDENENRDTLQLWVSDGQHIRCIGTISEKNKGEKTGNSILAQIDNNLYITHEINPFGVKKSTTTLSELDGVIALSPLPELFENAKTTVRMWRQLDEWFLTKGIPADELVGFLGNTKDEAVWPDKYNCVNATVKGGESVDGGFRFSGKAESGAKWPVASQGQNQLYKFTSKQFTLAATVKIHSASGADDVSLLGASINSQGNFVLSGIGFTKNHKWNTLNGNGWKKVTEFSFKLEKEYHVALTFADGVALVYVDGLNITNGTQMDNSHNWIDHFYMGRVGKQLKAEGSVCTIKNVMLFNRSLEEDEIAYLSILSNNGNSGMRISTEKSRAFLMRYNLLSNTKHKGTSADEYQKFDNDRCDYRNPKFQNNINRADGSLRLFAFVQFTCVVCAIILFAVV